MAAGARALAGLGIGDSHGGEVTLVLGLVQQDTSPALPHARRRTSGRATLPHKAEHTRFMTLALSIHFLTI